MTADPAVEAAYEALLASSGTWEPGQKLGQPLGRFLAELAVRAARPVILEEAVAAINAQCCHADERWNVQYTADDCQFCQPVMKAVRKLGETQA